jgi:D-alanine-D-alanine ligase
MIVKPSKEDNSNGVSLVKKSEDIQAALDEAFKWDDEVLVQEYIPGREIRVGVS